MLSILGEVEWLDVVGLTSLMRTCKVGHIRAFHFFHRRRWCLSVVHWNCFGARSHPGPFHFLPFPSAQTSQNYIFHLLQVLHFGLLRGTSTYMLFRARPKFQRRCKPQSDLNTSCNWGCRHAYGFAALYHPCWRQTWTQPPLAWTGIYQQRRSRCLRRPEAVFFGSFEVIILQNGSEERRCVGSSKHF